MEYHFDKLTDYLDSLQQLGIPACGCTVYRDHKPLYSHVVGYKDSGKTTLASGTDLYWLYSTSKVIICAAVLQLYEKGLLKLEDEVSKYLPEFKEMTVLHEGQTVKAKKAMTISHLMTMCSGLTYDLNTDFINKLKEATNNQATTKEMIGAIAQSPLSFEPGTHYQYSLSHDVLGAVIETVTGETFGNYLSEHIFEPLCMKDTGFELTNELKARLSAQYLYDNEQNKPIEIAADFNCYRLSERYESGGAGLLSTLEDYIKFADALSCGGTGFTGKRILSQESIDLMRTNRLDETCAKDFTMLCKPGYGYGLGVRTLIDKAAADAKSPLGEFGWDGAAGAYTLIDPVNHLSVFYGQHVLGCWPCGIVHPTIRNMVYEAVGF